jgi:hypothetical protein
MVSGKHILETKKRASLGSALQVPEQSFCLKNRAQDLGTFGPGSGIIYTWLYVEECKCFIGKNTF